MIEDRVESAKLRGLAKRGMAWAALGQGGTVGLHYVIMLVLAWRLAPAEFGLVGLATIFVFTVNAVAELGLGAAIVQRRELTPGHVGAVFWLSLAAGIGLASGLWAAAAPIAALMREPRLVSVLRPLALMVPVHALLVVPRALLQRSLRFARLAATEIGAEVVLGAVTIGLAYRGYGVWSLVTGLFARHVTRALLLWCVRPWRPTLRISAAECRDVLGFGGFVMGSMLATQVFSNVDYFVVGRYLGAAALAHYTLAFQLAIVPVQRIGEILSRVAFPSLARIQTDVPRLRRAFAQMLRTPAAFVASSSILLAIFAPALLARVYGPSWLPAARPLQLLALAAPFYVLDCSQVVFRAMGRPAMDLSLEAVRVLIFGLVATAALGYGTTGVAASILAAATVTGAVKLFAARRLTGERSRRSILPLAYALGALAAGAGLLAHSFFVTSAVAGMLVVTAAWVGCVRSPRARVRVAGLAGLDG